MDFPKLTDSWRIDRLQPPAGAVRMVLDTDTYNEIDDQFAVVYSLLAREKITLDAIYAAPFHNIRSGGPADGMEKSYEEILRLLDRLDVPADGFAFRGSTSWLSGAGGPVESPAASDLISRAMQRSPGDEPLYVGTIGAPTNVASAILMEPRIIERIVVVWLGGQPLHWRTASEFNLKQDLDASRVLLDSGVPLVVAPCQTVTSHLIMSVPEMEQWVAGQGRIGDYLCEIFKAHHNDHFCWGKVLWDIVVPAWLIDETWMPSDLAASPILTDQVTWSLDSSRHLIRVARAVSRNKIFRDLFTRLKQAAGN